MQGSRSIVAASLLAGSITAVAGCTASPSKETNDSVANGGTTATGATTTTGVSAATGGNVTTGGSPAVGSTVAGGSTTTGGKAATGGSTVVGGTAGGGSTAAGGKATTGGAVATGSIASTGGSTAAGGTKATGGTATAGGSTATGGAKATGGIATAGSSTATGGTNAIGGSSSGGQPGTGGASVINVDCTDTATVQGSRAVQFGGAPIPVTGSTKTYYFITNWWGLYSNQTVTYNGLSYSIADPGQSSVPADEGNPMGYPNFFIGSYSGTTTSGSNLPKQVSTLTSIPTVFSTNSLEKDTSNFNATYDVWFTASGTALGRLESSPGIGGAYLMVWMFKPSARQPRGGPGPGIGGVPTYSALAVDGVPGTWDVWIDNATDPPCISYVSSTPMDGLTFDLNRFIRDSVTKQYGITDSMYLSIIFAGFEIWGGGNGLQVKKFCANVM